MTTVHESVLGQRAQLGEVRTHLLRCPGVEVSTTADKECVAREHSGGDTFDF